MGVPNWREASMLDALFAGDTNFIGYLIGEGVAVQSMSWSGGTVTCTTKVNHGLSNNQRITLWGSTPSGYNGMHQITVVDVDTFTFALAADPGSYTSGAKVAVPLGALTGARDDGFTVASWSWSGGVLTVNTIRPHGYSSGMLVTLLDCDPLAAAGCYELTVVDVDTFTVPLGSDPGALVRARCIRFVEADQVDSAYARQSVLEAHWDDAVEGAPTFKVGPTGATKWTFPDVTDLAHVEYGAAIFTGADPEDDLVFKVTPTSALPLSVGQFVEFDVDNQFRAEAGEDGDPFA